ncbi:MAG: DUF177 domain-containing protein [Defluviitaleaceae bacterium]|nr:DUF177 domain-containing protein [Defluviitaleaceae bacterium]
MLVNLKEIKENKPLQLNEKLEILSHNLNLDGNIRLLDKEYELKAKVDAKATLTCDYCLINITHNISFNIEEILETEDEALEEFNLSPIISAYIHEHLPMQILCKEECLGLCKTCGINLNKKSCDCPNINEDSPFSKLLDLDF